MHQVSNPHKPHGVDSHPPYRVKLDLMPFLAIMAAFMCTVR